MEKRKYLLPVGKRQDGTDLFIPVIEIKGDVPGSVLGIIDRFEGPEGIKKII